jgi:DNA polymerase III subunit epsilon
VITRTSLRLRILLFFALLAVGSLLAIGAGVWLALTRFPELAAQANGLVQIATVAGFGSLGLIAWVWFLFDKNVARPIDLLAGALRARAHSDVDRPLEMEVARYLGDLAPAAGAASDRLAETRSALAEAIGRETARLTAEKARLERLLSDVPVGVMICAGDHQLVFYNSQAAEFLGAGGVELAHQPGLARSVFGYLREGPLQDAYQRLVETGAADAASDLICTPVQGRALLAGRMRLLGREGDAPGYVLTLRDVTQDFTVSARREAFIAEALERISRSVAGIATIREAAGEGGDAALVAALDAEVVALVAMVQDISRSNQERRPETLPYTMLRGEDVLDSIKARVEGAGLVVEVAPSALMIGCNAYELVGFTGLLCREIAKMAGVAQLELRLDEEFGGASLRIVWKGAPLTMAALERLLDLPLDAALPEATGRSFLAEHATDIWPEVMEGGLEALCLPILQARRSVKRPEPVARRVTYDFDLLGQERRGHVLNSRLDQLTYVVFDTETTGLLPQQGDEVVQIAAVRIVNGRRVEGEVFNTLVHPGRTIPAASTAVHGISDAMVADAPGVTDALARFHRFAEGAVLVAHNAPFDMTFLRRAEPAIGKRFDMPILDTVLLSAVVFSQHEEHSLDALTHRLGITISEEARHTALGDAVATADAFLKMLTMLRGRNIRTFDEVLTEVRKHGRLLKDLNA